MKKKRFLLFLIVAIVFSMKIYQIEAQTRSCPDCGVSSSIRCVDKSSKAQGNCFTYSGTCISFIVQSKYSEWACSGKVTTHRYRIQGEHDENCFHSLCSFYNTFCSY